MIRPGSSLSKQKKRVSLLQAKGLADGANAAAGNPGMGLPPGKKTGDSKPNLFEFLEKCDYVGAETILKFEKKAKEERPGGTAMWLAYAGFHNGEYRLALDNYEELLANPRTPENRVVH